MRARGRRRREKRSEKSEEQAASLSAKCPFPSIASLWPGRMESTEFSSGMKRKMAGTNSKTRREQAREIMRSERRSGGSPVLREMRKEAMVLL